MAHLRFILLLEEGYDIKLSTLDIVNLSSLGDAEDIIAEQTDG